MSNPEKWRGFEALPAGTRKKLGALPTLLAEKGVLLAYLFGSLAHHASGADVDLAILTDGEPAFRLRQPIADFLGTERVEIVDLSQAPPVLSFEIISTGYPLYAPDEEERLRFELEVVRTYKDTDYLRRRQERLLKRRMAAWSSKETVS